MKILVADDEPIERMVVKKKIKNYFEDSLEVVEATNGNEVVELYEKERFPIAILDIRMPGMTGLEAAERIRAMHGDCAIIFLTAYDDFKYAKKAITVKALDYLLKPTSDDELVACLSEAVRIAEENGNRKYLDFNSDRELIDDSAAMETHDGQKLKKIKEMMLQYIEDNYSEDIALSDLADYMKYSEAYLCKMFKQCFDQGFIAYLTEFRVDKAKKLLSDPTANVKDVSISVGYRDSNYFTKVFKRSCNMTPTEYQKNNAE